MDLPRPIFLLFFTDTAQNASSRPLKKAHLPRSRLQIALDVLFKYASDDLKASALHLHLFERPEIVFFNILLVKASCL